MNYAIVAHSGKQYKVKVGDTIDFDHIQDAKQGAEMMFDHVLFVADGDKRVVGQPEVKGAQVAGTVVEETAKGEKVRVAKFKAKVRYRKVRGFRAQLTRVKITGISLK